VAGVAIRDLIAPGRAESPLARSLSECVSALPVSLADARSASRIVAL
jgi:hypothetical protein